MRHAAALTLAGLAVVAGLALLAQGWACGMQRVEPDAPGTSGERFEPECVSRIHPLAVPLLLVGAAAVAMVAFGAPVPLLVMGLVTAGLGLVGGLSLGLYGFAVGALVTAAGIVAPVRERAQPVPALVRGAAAVALALQLGLVLGAFRLGPSLELVWLAALGPAAAWLCVAASAMGLPRPGVD